MRVRNTPIRTGTRLALHLILFRDTILISYHFRMERASYSIVCSLPRRLAITRDRPTNRRDKLSFRPYQLFVIWASIVYNNITTTIIITFVLVSLRDL